MKLTATLLLGLAGLSPTHAAVVGPASGSVDGVMPATVLEVNPAGVGHVNLVPYFSTRSGFDTYLNIVNTDTRNGKAVKLRFRSAVNGEDVGNFTVLLAPGDAWAAALTLDAASGYPKLVHNDRSCTLPANAAVTLGPAFAPASSYFEYPPTDPTRAQEGSVEIVTMADIPRPSWLFSAINTAESPAALVCGSLGLDPLAVDSTSYADAQSKGLEVPSSGLRTDWTLINVPRAVAYVGRATAVEARVGAGGSPGYGNIVLFPQTAAWVSDAARTVSFTTDPSIRDVPPQVTSGYMESELPDLSTPYLPAGLASLAAGAAARRQAHAISKALATTSIAGEFVTEPAILARTDWVVAQPTRHLEVGYRLPDGMGGWGTPVVIRLDVDDTGAPTGVTNFFATSQLDGGYDPPCTTGPDPYTPGVATTTRPHTETTWRTRDAAHILPKREAALTYVIGGITYTLPFSFCGHSSILRFVHPGDDETTGALGGARNRRLLISGADAGWGRLQTSGLGGRGLPLIGFAVSELFNAAVTPGMAGAFGLTYPLGTSQPAP